MPEKTSPRAASYHARCFAPARLLAARLRLHSSSSASRAGNLALALGAAAISWRFSHRPFRSFCLLNFVRNAVECECILTPHHLPVICLRHPLLAALRSSIIPVRSRLVFPFALGPLIGPLLAYLFSDSAPVSLVPTRALTVCLSLRLGLGPTVRIRIVRSDPA